METTMTQIPEVSVWPGLSLLRGALALPEFSCALGAEGWEDTHGEDRLDGGMLLTLQPRGHLLVGSQTRSCCSSWTSAPTKSPQLGTRVSGVEMQSRLGHPSGLLLRPVTSGDSRLLQGWVPTSKGNQQSRLHPGNTQPPKRPLTLPSSATFLGPLLNHSW